MILWKEKKNVGKKIKELFGIDIRSLALFRIGLAIVLLGDLAIRGKDLLAFYTDEGVLPRDIVIYDILGRWDTSFHLMSGTWEVQLVLFFLAGFAAFFLLIGYHSRFFAFLSYIFLLSLQARNPLILQGGDNVLRLLVFWAIFLPLDRCCSIASIFRRRDHLYDALSIDSKLEEGVEAAKNSEREGGLEEEKSKRSKQVVSVATAALLLQICFIYWFSALLKSDPVWTTDGTAVWYALSNEFFATHLGLYLLGFPMLLKFFTFSTYYLELCGPFFAFVPFWTAPLRFTTALIFILFHLIALNLTMELGVFPYVCTVAWFVFLPSWFWEKLEAKRKKKNLLPSWDNPLFSRLNKVLFAWCDPAGHNTNSQPTILGQEEEKEWKASPLSNILAAFFISYIFLWNVQTLNINSAYFPRSIGLFLGLSQTWDMFAPYPLKDDGWFIVTAKLKGGGSVDLYTGGEINWEKPKLVSKTFTNDRWRSFMMYLYLNEYNKTMLSYYANYLWRRWNEEQGNSHQLSELAIFFMKKINDIENPHPLTKKELLWSWKEEMVEAAK